jgi:Flp pilus assembly protein TadG
LSENLHHILGVAALKEFVAKKSFDPEVLNMRKKRTNSCKGPRHGLLRLLSSDAGNGALAFALALPALMAGAGVAVDFGMVGIKQAKLQAAADQAAIAAVKQLTIVNYSETSVVNSAKGFADSIINDASINLSVDVAIGAQNDQVKVTLQENWTPFFAHFLNAGITPIVVDATAKLAGKTNLCVLALAPRSAKAIRMDKTAKMLATGCSVYSNSKDAEGVRLDASSEIVASMVCSAGGFKSKSGVIKPSATTDCPVIEDPLASRKAPNLGACVKSKLVLKSGKHTLNPGTYCGGLQITGNAQVEFLSGEYIIDNGKFEISSLAHAKGTDVAFYLSGEATTLQFTDDATISLSGSESGSMAGLLFFEDRTTTTARRHRINSTHADELTGTIYMPRGHLLIDPNASVAQNSAYTAIIAYELEVNEGPTLVLNNNYNDTDVPVPDGIQSSSQVVLSE